MLRRRRDPAIGAAARRALAVSIVPVALITPVGHGLDRATQSSSCATTVPGSIHALAGVRQAITVVASSTEPTVATVTAWQRHDGCWSTALGPWLGRVGRGGVRVVKREGDGATPWGVFPLYSTIYGTAPNPGVRLQYRRLHCGDWWDEDVSSATYDTFQQVPCDNPDPPFANGVSEPLWRSPATYAAFAVIGYNTSRVPGRGSAIFLHVSVGLATSGCVALARPLLDEVLRWLRRDSSTRIVIATATTLSRLEGDLVPSGAASRA